MAPASTTPPVDDPLVGTRVGSYVVDAQIGSGAMGTVYLGVQPQIGKRVAIKFLTEELGHNAELVARFFEEARSVNVIGHENIVDVYDFGRTPSGRNYFVMELLDGRSLDAHLATEGALSAARAVDIGRQIARALGAAHARGIVHRDLKPENVFLVTLRGRADFVKIVDFGIAKLTGRDAKARTAAGTILGTPGYMAPEQATGGAVDQRVDVYALGVLLHRMLAGQLPFPGRNLGEILQQQLLDEPPPLARFRADLPDGLATLVLGMLAREPEARVASMEEVEAALGRIAARRPSTAVRFAPPERAGPGQGSAAGVAAAARAPTVGAPAAPLGPATATAPAVANANANAPTPIRDVERPSRLPFLLALLVGILVGMGVLALLWSRELASTR